MRKEFVGAAPTKKLAADITATATSFDIDDATGYPTGAAAPFVVVIGRGTGVEEKILCASRSLNTFTVAASGRGYDGTTAFAQKAGSLVEHVVDSIVVDEANAHVNDDTRDDHGQYLTTARHNDIDAADHTSGSATDGTVLTADGAGGAAWEALVIPPAVPSGAIAAYGGASAPSGWLLCDGAAVSRTTYADLYAILGDAYGAGDGTSTFNLPNLQQRFPLGKAGALGTGDTLGATGGVIDHGHSASGSAGNSGNHAHNASASATAGNSGNHAHNATTSVSVGAGGDHSHSASSGGPNSNSSTGGGADVIRASGNHSHAINVGNSGNHGHNGSGSTSVGAGGDHSHTVNASATVGAGGDHSHTVSVSVGTNNPPFQVVNYIIKA